MTSELQPLLVQYARVRAELDRVEEVDGEDSSKPFPKASEAALRAYEKRIGFALPPSYRAFLKQHDGWQCFWGALWITGTSGKAKKFVDAQIADWKKYVKHRLGPPDADPENFDPAAFVVIGADDNGGFLVLARKARADGERDILDMPRGFAENRWRTFRHFVADQLRFRRRELARARQEAARDAAEDATSEAPKVSTKKRAAKKPAKLATKKP